MLPIREHQLTAQWPPHPPVSRCPPAISALGPPPTIDVTTAICSPLLAARVHPSLVLAAACWLALWAVPFTSSMPRSGGYPT
jgi:hypothetical protein